MAEFSVNIPSNIGVVRGDSFTPSSGLGKENNDFSSQFVKTIHDWQEKLSGATNTGLVIDASWGQGSLTISTTNRFILATPAAKDLIEAREYVNKNLYQQALIPLRRAFNTTPTPPQTLRCEAAYLLGFCYFQLQKPEEALASLGILADAKLSDQLAAQVKGLRNEIRKNMMPLVMLKSLLQMQTGQTEQAISDLSRIVNLDPECGIYHFMLAGNLLTADRLEEAEAAVVIGEKYCDADERQMLENIKQQIERRALENALQPAREHFRRGKYSNACIDLENLAPKYQTATFYRIFYNYLQTLSKASITRNHKLSQLAPPVGSFTEVERLYFFLVGSDIREAKDMMNEAQFAEAKQKLEVAINFAPHFPFANYLLAICIYGFVKEGSAKDTDTAISMLITALKYAEIGATDEEIKDTQELITVIKQHLDTLRDAKPVNDAIAEFQSIMATAGGGIDSPEQLGIIENRLLVLRATLPSLRANIKNRDGVKSIGELDEAIGTNLLQIKQIKAGIAEAETVRLAMNEFSDIMSDASDGINSINQFRNLKKRIENLRDLIKKLQRVIRNEDAKQALKQLEEAVARNYAQLAAIDL